uniref:PH domain-containing protein n=1 Tax=Strigamia maritima TaxID=126957 RepID=T1JE23_STRMM
MARAQTGFILAEYQLQFWAPVTSGLIVVVSTVFGACKIVYKNRYRSFRPCISQAKCVLYGFKRKNKTKWRVLFWNLTRGNSHRIYFMGSIWSNHNKQETTLVHPITKDNTLQTEIVHQQPQAVLLDSIDSANMETKKTTPKKKPVNPNVRSPIVKRNNQSPVTIQGWLWKQGSEGFMRWKKRWFVLTDFCLFYYNGPEEEKILGTILLPSYEISSCGSESKVNRKFAFRLEHQNMRTYYLAAETKESYQQWMNALTLATLLQRELHREDRHETILRPDGQYGQSGTEDEDSGFTSYHSRRYVGSPSQNGNSPHNGSFSSDCVRMRPEDMYHDVPHNDRSGINDIHLANNEKYPNSYVAHPIHRPPQNGSPMYAPPKPKRMVAVNPEQMMNYGGHPYGPYAGYPEYPPQGYPQEMDPPHVKPQDWGPQINYGYSPGDYYAPSRMNPMEAQRSANYNMDQHQMSPRRIDYRDQYDPAVLREKGHKLYRAQRPHSANFLEHDYEPEQELMREVPQMRSQRVKGSRGVSRPKSSGEQYNVPEYWDEGVTNDMYQQHQPPHTPHTPHPNMWEVQRNPDTSYDSYESSSQDQMQQIEKEPDGNTNAAFPAIRRPPPNDTQFIRSASARLPSETDGYSREADGEEPKHAQQREESMKRLLEWKQRMLQSPLTKKYPQQKPTPARNVAPGTPKKAMEYRKMEPADVGMENYRKPDEIDAKRNLFSRTIDNKPLGGTLHRYRNSYSSDDEESVTGSLKGLYLSRTQPRRRKNDLLKEDPNMSDSELQLRGKMQNVKLHDGLSGNNLRLSISAGDLLGKTHEELILLLIQLRRTQARLQKAMDTCRIELEGEKKLMQIDAKNRKIHSKKVEELTLQLEECSKQFELSKPLVNLVDNMVKLGSWYGGSDQALTTQYQITNLPYPDYYSPPKKMIEFTRKLQEQRLLDEEQSEWNELVPDQVNLQNKLEKLYQLDKSLQDESVVLTNLQQDKNMLEKALISIQTKAQLTGDNAMEQERLQRQRRIIEAELDKVQMQLVGTTRKLEETAAENARIEHEILVLRQKIHQTLKKASSIVPAFACDDVETAQLKVQLEEELAHVQSIMDELAKRRKDISGAVEKIKQLNSKKEIRPSPTGVSGSAPLPGRKIQRSTYLETDLDTMETHDVLDEVCRVSEVVAEIEKPMISTIVPLYVNADSLDDKEGNDDLYLRNDITEADDRTKRFYGIIPREKVEVKTVRIVKRESERRNKGKEKRKVTYEEQPLSRVIEEPESASFDDFDYLEDLQDFQRSMSLPRNYGRAVYIPAEVQPSGKTVRPPNSLPLTTTTTMATTTVTTTNKILPNVPYYYRTPTLSAADRPPSAHERLFGSPGHLDSPPRSPLATPEFKSEVARQIVAETAQQLVASLNGEPQLNLTFDTNINDRGSLKRRYKRRHYTISSSQPLTLEATSPKMIHARSRDDLDMERCLRSANTPDVVKSTIKKSENFDESTIDRELGLPQKILIPERYIEQEEEELTNEEKLHRIQKAEAIKKMLSESTTYGDLTEDEVANASETLKKKFKQEKKQREQLLTLNQQLAQERIPLLSIRMNKFKAKAMQNVTAEQLSNSDDEDDDDDQDLSPVGPMPTIQQLPRCMKPNT